TAAAFRSPRCAALAGCTKERTPGREPRRRRSLPLMTLVVVALLAVVGAILANAISSLIGDSVFTRVRTTKARIVALGTVAVVAILVGAAAAWVQALSTSNKGQTAGPGELTQPVQTTVAMPSTVT